VHTLLDDGPTGVVLQVEQVTHVLAHRSPTGAKVRALEVGQGFKALLPHKVLPITDREKHNRHLGGGGEVALTQEGETDLCHLLDDIVKLAADDGSRPSSPRHHQLLSQLSICY
jgi:hypothetical protein